jgi:subtilisin family serine protease
VRLELALEETPDIISMSAGTTTRIGGPLLALQNFWEGRLSKVKGTVLVAAAGNDGNRGPFYPAAFPWCVSVGALDEDGTRAEYTNFGSWVDVYARGTQVVNAYPRGWYRYREAPFAGQWTNFLVGMASWDGTSFATPLVSGLIAARMTWSGESAQQAADSLLKLALQRARPGVGAVLEPGMASSP